jgi:hypothetical protein
VFYLLLFNREYYASTRDADVSGKSKEDRVSAAADLAASNNSEAVALSLFLNNFIFGALFLLISQYALPQIAFLVELPTLYNFVVSVAFPSIFLFLRAKQIL